jgi:uncharacterized membrane protein YfcA
LTDHTKRRTIAQIAAFYTGLGKSAFAGGVGIGVTPLMAMVYPAKHSLALVLPLLILSDTVNFYLYWGQWNASAAFRLLPGAVVGIIITTRHLVNLPEYWVKKSLGILALVFVPVQIARMVGWIDFQPANLPITWATALGLCLGLLIGVFTTMGHVGGIISSIYFLLVLEPGESFPATLVGTSTVLFFSLNAVKLVTFTRAGLLNRTILRQLPALIPVLAVGLGVGKLINNVLGDPGRARWFVYIMLATVIIMGWKLIRTPRPAEPQDA